MEELLNPDNLPFVLGEMGMITYAEPDAPGVYRTILRRSKSLADVEAFAVFQSVAEISASAKAYGQSAPDYPDILIFAEDTTPGIRHIVEYEISCYKVRHHLPLSRDENIRDLSAFGTEIFPEYFGSYPVPSSTPWGYTTRHKTIANGIYWMESESGWRGLAIAYPKHEDLSNAARGLAEKYQTEADGLEPRYLFFRETDSSVPLFELLANVTAEQLCCEIDQEALMNAVYCDHPEYAAQYNLTEQTGITGRIGLLLYMLGEESKPGNVIKLGICLKLYQGV